MKNIPFIIRQGDVIIRRISELPENLTPIKRDKRGVVLAEGEISGHFHGIATKGVKHYAAPDAGVTYLEVQEAMALLKHDEHATAKLPPGKYEVRIQREYRRKEITRVID